MLYFRIDHKREAAVDPAYRGRLLRTMRENNALGISNEPYKDMMCEVEYAVGNRFDTYDLEAAYHNWSH